MEATDRSTGTSRNPQLIAAARPHTLSALTPMARRVVVTSIALLVTACSSLKLGYNNADTLLIYTLDSYLDLDGAQKQLAREHARSLHAWHRSTQLEDYARLLREAERRIEGGMRAEDVLELQGRMNTALAVVGERAAPRLAELALTLQPAQIDHLTDKLTADTSKARRELIRFAGQETLDYRVKRYTERAESWLGRLRQEQQDLVRENLRDRPADHSWWMEERERRQKELVTVLQRIRTEQPDAATATAWLREYFALLASPREAERQARSTQFRAANAELIAQLVNSASPAQKATLVRRLRGYADDFATLAAAGSRS
jgi:hypothetical protein